MSAVKALTEKQIDFAYEALMHLEYIVTESEDFGACEEEFKARAFAAHQIIQDILTNGRCKHLLKSARKDVKEFDKMRRKKAA